MCVNPALYSPLISSILISRASVVEVFLLNIYIKKTLFRSFLAHHHPSSGCAGPRCRCRWMRRVRLLYRPAPQQPSHRVSTCILIDRSESSPLFFFIIIITDRVVLLLSFFRCLHSSLSHQLPRPFIIASVPVWGDVSLRAWHRVLIHIQCQSPLKSDCNIIYITLLLLDHTSPFHFTSLAIVI